jgi:hypothetical protein
MGGEGCGTALERSRFGAEGLKHRQKLAGAAIATLPGVPPQPDPDPGRLGRGRRQGQLNESRRDNHDDRPAGGASALAYGY